ncbi:MAG: hypothetical protein R3331_04475 [Sulfurospirillaceae bacterium]|nr:hypothetical protein [Sulfurospirillaceae bacterium]
MTLLVPIDAKEIEDAVICQICDKQSWALVSIEQGSVKECQLCDSKEDITQIIDYIVIKDKNEDVDSFIQEGIEVLVISSQKYVDDIIEAFMFRELHQLGE